MSDLQEIKKKISQQVLKGSELTCKQGNPINRVCVNIDCLSALTCGNNECSDCGGKTHKSCNYISFHNFTQLLNEPINLYGQFIEKVEAISRKHIDQFAVGMRQLVECFIQSELRLIKEKEVRDIYSKQNQHGVRGEVTNQLYLKARQISKQKSKMIKELIPKYSSCMNTITEQMTWMQKELLGCYDSLTDFPFSRNGVVFDLQIERQPIKPRRETSQRNLTLSSSVATMRLERQSQAVPKIEGISKTVEFREIVKVPWYGSNNMISRLPSQQLQFLFCSLDYPKKLEMLFRASEHKFKVAAFHQHCDNIQDTLVIVHTEFGKTIGGFTHYKWDTTSRSIFDEGRKAFLLQMDLMQKMVFVGNIKSHQLIWCGHQLGPAFGLGNDLCVGQDCNTTNSSHALFPTSYNLDGPNKYTQNQESYKAFSGATSGYYFKVQEYEVYRVVYQ